jgi:anti-sigma factor RsiW
MTRRFSDLTLERYRLGELPAEEAAELQRCLAADEALAERLTQLDRSSEEMRGQRLPDRVADGVRQRARDRARTERRPRVVVLASLAAAAVLAVAIMPRVLPPTAPGDGVRIKGLAPSLVLFRKTASGSEALEDGARVRAGDVVRVGYRAAGRRYGVILSIDGRGVVTPHLPRQGRDAARLAGGDATLLDRAYELDDAPRWERFYLVTADVPFDAMVPLESARTLAASAGAAPPAALPLPASLQQTAFTLDKETGR